MLMISLTEGSKEGRSKDLHLLNLLCCSFFGADIARKQLTISGGKNVTSGSQSDFILEVTIQAMQKRRAAILVSGSESKAVNAEAITGGSRPRTSKTA